MIVGVPLGGAVFQRMNVSKCHGGTDNESTANAQSSSPTACSIGRPKDASLRRDWSPGTA